MGNFSSWWNTGAGYSWYKISSFEIGLAIDSLGFMYGGNFQSKVNTNLLTELCLMGPFCSLVISFASNEYAREFAAYVGESKEVWVGYPTNYATESHVYYTACVEFLGLVVEWNILGTDIE